MRCYDIVCNVSTHSQCFGSPFFILFPPRRLALPTMGTIQGHRRRRGADARCTSFSAGVPNGPEAQQRRNGRARAGRPDLHDLLWPIHRAGERRRANVIGGLRFRNVEDILEGGRSQCFAVQHLDTSVGTMLPRRMVCVG